MLRVQDGAVHVEDDVCDGRVPGHGGALPRPLVTIHWASAVGCGVVAVDWTENWVLLSRHCHTLLINLPLSQRTSHCCSEKNVLYVSDSCFCNSVCTMRGECLLESCECPDSSADVTTLSRKVFQQPGLLWPTVCLWAAESHGNGHVTDHIMYFQHSGKHSNISRPISNIDILTFKLVFNCNWYDVHEINIDFKNM